MLRIILFNLTSAEISVVKDAFQNEPDCKFNVAGGIPQLKYYVDLLNDDLDLVLFGCGRELLDTAVLESLGLLDEIKYFWPDLQVALVSLEPRLVEETYRVLKRKVISSLNISAKGGLKGQEIVEKIKSLLAGRLAEKAQRARIPGIMLVDDDPAILATLQLVLKSAGECQLWPASDIDGAAKIISQNLKNLDLCFIDYNLKGQTSERLIDAIYQMDPEIKIFVVTGEGSTARPNLPPGVIKKAYKVIPKPFDTDEIIKAVQIALSAESARKPRILVIDDQPETATILRGFLSDDFIISDADTGQAGLEKFKEIVPDLVILDYKLPDLSGLDVFKEMKKIKQNPRVLVITIERDPAVINQFIELGAAEVVHKPFIADELEATVRKLFTKEIIG